MSTLFTINKSPAAGLLDPCLKTASAGDCVLFLEDGVYHGINAEVLRQIPDDIKVCSLKEDLVARGLKDRLQERSHTASYRQFVQLCVEYDKVVSWF